MSLFNIQPTRAANFINKDEILNKIQTSFNLNEVVFLVAPTGNGKSTAAIEYGKYFKENESKNVYWLYADSLEKFENEYRKLAAFLCVDVNLSENEMIIAKTNELLLSLGEVLFIIDNLENYELIEKFMKNLPPNVKVIITCVYNLNENDLFRSINLEAFSFKDCEVYLRKCLKERINKDNINEIISFFKTDSNTISPYSLEKCVSYINSSFSRPISSLINDIKQNINKGESEVFLLIKNVQELANKTPFEILQYAIFLDPDFISLKIFTELFKINDAKLELSIRDITKLSLAELVVDKNKNKGLKFHRNTVKQIKAYMNKNKISLELKKIQLLKFLDKMFMEVDASDVNKYKENEFYVWHVVKILKMNLVSDNDDLNKKKDFKLDRNSLFYKLGKYNSYVSKNYERANYYYIANYEVLNSINEIDEVKKLELTKSKFSLLKMIGKNYDKLNEQEKSIEYNKKALLVRKKIKSQDDEQVANLLHSIGTSYDKLENYEDAIKNKSSALDIRKKLNNQLEVASSFNSLGYSYHMRGDYRKALELDQEALRIREKIHGVNHIEIAESLYNIGSNYGKLSEWQKSFDYHEKAYYMRKQVYEDSLHPHIANSLHALALASDNLGDTESSIFYDKRCLEIRKKIYPPDHPFIQHSLNNLELGYAKLGRKEISIEYKRESDSMAKTKGSTSSRTLPELKRTPDVIPKKVRDWKKEDLLNWFRQQNINAYIYKALASSKHSNPGKMVENYFLMSIENPKYFIQALLVDTNDQVSLDDIKQFEECLKKLFLNYS